MRSSLLAAALLAGAVTAAPASSSSSSSSPSPNTKLARQSQPCFVIGDVTLPAETEDAAAALANTITCSNSATTIDNVPDVTSGSTTFSDIDFSQSSQKPLEFALSQFATADPLADSDLQTFTDSLNTYVATEAGIRSVDGDLAIKIPKFFLEFQVSRIETAQGNPPTDAGLQVDHLRDKVLSNAAGEDQDLLDQVTALATQLQ